MSSREKQKERQKSIKNTLFRIDFKVSEQKSDNDKLLEVGLEDII